MTNGRYSSRNSTERVNIAKIEEDTKCTLSSVATAIDAIDETLRVLPDNIEILASRGDKEGIKKLLALAATANDDSEAYKKDLDALRERQDEIVKQRPTRPKFYADHYSKCFQVGAEAVALNQRINNNSGGLVEQIVGLIDSPAKEEVKS